VTLLAASGSFAAMLAAVPLSTRTSPSLSPFLLQRPWRIAGAVVLCCAQALVLLAFLRYDALWVLIVALSLLALLCAWTVVATLFASSHTPRRRAVTAAIAAVSASVLGLAVVLVVLVWSPSMQTPSTPEISISPRFQNFVHVNVATGTLTLQNMDRRNPDAQIVIDNPGLLATEIIDKTAALSPPLTECILDADNLFHVDQVMKQMNALCERQRNVRMPLRQVTTLAIINCRYNIFHDARIASIPPAFTTLSSLPALDMLAVTFPDDGTRQTDAYTPVNDIALLHHCLVKSWPTQTRITTVDCSYNATIIAALVDTSTTMFREATKYFVDLVHTVLTRPTVTSLLWQHCAFGALSPQDLQTLARLFHDAMSGVGRTTRIEIDLRENELEEFQKNNWTASIATTNPNIVFVL